MDQMFLKFCQNGEISSSLVTVIFSDTEDFLE